jgi:hypothetical protein
MERQRRINAIDAALDPRVELYGERAAVNEKANAVEARGGFLGRPVLVVLIVSSLLLIAIFGGLYVHYFG